VKVTSKHGDVAAPYVYGSATLGANHQVILNFSEGVKHVSTSTLTVYALSPAKDRFKSAAPVSAITCSDGIHTVNCSGAGGLATSAVLTVPSLASGGEYQVYANLRQVTSQLTDGNGNPTNWNWVAAEVKAS
jgi:hypothetical protein